MDVDYVKFSSRFHRCRYAAETFGRFLRGRVLDVGCDNAFLKQLLPDSSHVGVDIAGNPDIILNLERITHLPFADETFDCVVCLDVLEHLDNLHPVFGELVRATKRYIVVSLPNNWANARGPLGRGTGKIGHYGLPADAPQDRHKWFFSLSEARDFIDGQQERHAITTVAVRATEKPRPLLVRGLRRLRYRRKEQYLNRYAHTLWAVLEKH